MLGIVSSFIFYSGRRGRRATDAVRNAADVRPTRPTLFLYGGRRNLNDRRASAVRRLRVGRVGRVGHTFKFNSHPNQSFKQHTERSIGCYPSRGCGTTRGTFNSASGGSLGRGCSLPLPLRWADLVVTSGATLPETSGPRTCSWRTSSSLP